MTLNVIRWDGKPISKPGIYSGVPMEAYHADLCDAPSVSSGGLRTIESKSCAHYFATSYLNPEPYLPDSSDALSWGRAVHHLFGGEDHFHRYFAVRPAKLNGTAWQGNRTECKDWLKAVAAEGKEVVTEAQVEHIKGMAHSLARHPAVRAGILNGEVERSLVWRDPITGVWLKARPDVLHTDSEVIADLKTCAGADHHSVCNSITSYGYHMQLALAGEGMRVLTGRRITDYVLVFVEKLPPYAVTVKTVDLTDIEYGRRQLRRAIDRFARCVETGDWPGYEDEDQPATLQPYYRKRLADEAERRELPELEYEPFPDMEPAE